MERQRFSERSFFSLKMLQKKGFDFFELLQKKDVFCYDLFFFGGGGNIERWSVVGKYLLFLFLFPLAFFLDQVFWPCGIVFVMKLSQV